MRFELIWARTAFDGSEPKTLRTERPKMKKEQWWKHIPELRRAVDDAGEVEQTQTAKVWHDNETFLVNDARYTRPRSWTVWSWLWTDLAKREGRRRRNREQM